MTSLRRVKFWMALPQRLERGPVDVREPVNILLVDETQPAKLLTYDLLGELREN